MTRKSRRPPAGVTLIELLCAVAIIAVLATLLLGPAGRALGKARAMQWNDRAHSLTSEITDRLYGVFVGQKEFPRVTLADLEKDGLVTAAQAKFLRDDRVRFTPFAGSDPDDLPVIQVTFKPAFLDPGGTVQVTKGDLTRERR
jgi:prepilin-type N-terminal cleavage/methylation domain-containing protein